MFDESRRVVGIADKSFRRFPAETVPGLSRRQELVLVHDECRSSGGLDRARELACERGLTRPINPVDRNDSGTSKRNNVSGQLLTARVHRRRHQQIMPAKHGTAPPVGMGPGGDPGVRVAPLGSQSNRPGHSISDHRWVTSIEPSRQPLAEHQESAAALDPAILAFYRTRYEEDERLSRTRHGQLEFRRTQQLLRRFLPTPPAALLDVGGGTGVHARWLAKEGYDVILIDPVAEHVALASAVGSFTAQVGDARLLVHRDRSMDAVLLLGPLYHLPEVRDRQQAMREAVRVTRPGGVIAVAAIGRYAPLLELAGLGELDDDAVSELSSLLATGVHLDEPQGFTSAYFHRPEELAQEMTDAGLRDVLVLGIEGPITAAVDNAAADIAEAVLESAVVCAQLLERDPAFLNCNPHMLGIGYAP